MHNLLSFFLPSLQSRPHVLTIKSASFHDLCCLFPYWTVNSVPPLFSPPSLSSTQILHLCWNSSAGKRERRGWIIANNPIFWSSKAAVGLSDNFVWSITINTNKIKCVGGAEEGEGAWPGSPLNRPCDQFSLSISVLSTSPFSWEGGDSHPPPHPPASLWSDYPFISSLSEEYLGDNGKLKNIWGEAWMFVSVDRKERNKHKNTK